MLRVVPVPGEAPWCREEVVLLPAAGLPPAASLRQAEKRGRGEDGDEAMDEAAAEEELPQDALKRHRTDIVPASTDQIVVGSSTAGDLLPLPGETRPACLVKLYCTQEASPKLNEVLRSCFCSSKSCEKHATSRKAHYLAALDCRQQ